MLPRTEDVCKSPVPCRHPRSHRHKHLRVIGDLAVNALTVRAQQGDLAGNVKVSESYWTLGTCCAVLLSAAAPTSHSLWEVSRWAHGRVPRPAPREHCVQPLHLQYCQQVSPLHNCKCYLAPRGSSPTFVPHTRTFLPSTCLTNVRLVPGSPSHHVEDGVLHLTLTKLEEVGRCEEEGAGRGAGCERQYDVPKAPPPQGGQAFGAQDPGVQAMACV